ncbi:hypothetical protein JMUB7531_29090 [Staphylococcus aureus]
MSRGRGDVYKRQFFKQKTAYEICACLVGSEMCIRDSPYAEPPVHDNRFKHSTFLYTSDAADDGESVDLGGRRIIKKHI